MPLTSDFLVIGAGIVGSSVALELKRRYPDCSIRLIDKEPTLGAHGSGRNSGVLHAGFYYSKDSLKARLTRDGNHYWQAFCAEHGLNINKCGKLVVATNEAEDKVLDELLARAKNNKVPLRE